MEHNSKNMASTERCPKDGKFCHIANRYKQVVKERNIYGVISLAWALLCFILLMAVAGCGVNHYMSATMVDRFGDTTGFTFIEYGKGNVLNYGN